jgi:hypothetical protein
LSFYGQTGNYYTYYCACGIKDPPPSRCGAPYFNAQDIYAHDLCTASCPCDGCFAPKDPPGFETTNFAGPAPSQCVVLPGAKNGLPDLWADTDPDHWQWGAGTTRFQWVGTADFRDEKGNWRFVGLLELENRTAGRTVSSFIGLEADPSIKASSPKHNDSASYRATPQGKFYLVRSILHQPFADYCVLLRKD